MQKTQKLSSYEQKQANRIIAMWNNLVAAGMSHEDAMEKIIVDLKSLGSSIGPNFVRMALNK